MVFLLSNTVLALTCCGPSNASYCVDTCSGWEETENLAPCGTSKVCCAFEGSNCGSPESIYDQIPEGAADAGFQEVLKEASEAQQSAGQGGSYEFKGIKKQAASLNPLDISGPSDLFANAINLMMAFMGSIALLLYIYGGFLWMSAAGNADRVGKAKTILVWTTLGVIAIGASYMIVRTVLEKVG